MPKNEAVSIICYSLPGLPTQQSVFGTFNMVLESKASTFKDIEESASSSWLLFIKVKMVLLNTFLTLDSTTISHFYFKVE